MYLCVYVQEVRDEMSRTAMKAVLAFFFFCALSWQMQQENAYLLGMGAMQPNDFPQKRINYKHPRNWVFLSVLQLFTSESYNKVNMKRWPKQQKKERKKKKTQENKISDFLKLFWKVKNILALNYKPFISTAPPNYSRMDTLLLWPFKKLVL